MLSAATLERVSVSYRNGYRDGYTKIEHADRLPVDLSDNSQILRPFANRDYSEGFKAGANDRKWAEHYGEIK